MQTIEERLDQLEKRRGSLTVVSIAMMVAIATSSPLVEMILQALQQIVIYLTSMS